MHLYLNLVFDVTRAYICVCVCAMLPLSAPTSCVRSCNYVFIPHILHTRAMGKHMARFSAMPSRLVNCVQELTNLQVKSNFRFFFKSSLLLVCVQSPFYEFALAFKDILCLVYPKLLHWLVTSCCLMITLNMN